MTNTMHIMLLVQTLTQIHIPNCKIGECLNAAQLYNTYVHNVPFFLCLTLVSIFSPLFLSYSEVAVEFILS